MVLRSDEEGFWSASFSPVGKRIVFAKVRDAGIRDISSLEQGDAFQVACQRLGNNTGLADVETRYGLSDLAPICGDHPPLLRQRPALR